MSTPILLLLALGSSSRVSHGMRMDLNVIDYVTQLAPEFQPVEEAPMCPWSVKPATFPAFDVLLPKHAPVVKVFNSFLQLFTDLGINGICRDGTLLGAYRHQGMIPYDLDMDVTFNVMQNLPLIEKSNSQLKGKTPTEIVAMFDKMGKHAFIKMTWDEVLYPLLKPHGVSLVHQKMGGWTLRISNGLKTFDGGMLEDPPKGAPLDLMVEVRDRGPNAVCKCTFGNAQAFCPTDSPKELAETYGEDYMVPKSQCVYMIEDFEGRGKVNRHPDHARSTEECKWAEDLIAGRNAASKSAQQTYLSARVSMFLKVFFVIGAAALSSWACWLIYWAVRTTGFSMGITTGTQVAIFIAYIALSTSHMFLQQRSGTTGYSVISATILVYFGKLAVSLALFLWRADLRADSLDLGGAKFGKWVSIFLLIGTGGCFACYDALSFLVLFKVDPATYQVLVHTRVIFVATLWQVVFKTKLSWNQWQALTLLIMAGATKVMGRSEVLDTATLGGALCLMAVQCSLCAAANVYSEAILKDMAKMPTDLVNAIVYFWGLVTLVTVMMVTQGPEKVHSELFSRAAWAKLQADPFMQGSIATLIVFGIVTAYLIKTLSNIVKEMAGAFVIVISGVLGVIFQGHKVMIVLDFMGVILAVLSIAVYGTEPLRNQPAAVETKAIEGKDVET